MCGRRALAGRFGRGELRKRKVYPIVREAERAEQEPRVHKAIMNLIGTRAPRLAAVRPRGMRPRAAASTDILIQDEPPYDDQVRRRACACAVRRQSGSRESRARRDAAALPIPDDVHERLRTEGDLGDLIPDPDDVAAPQAVIEPR